MPDSTETTLATVRQRGETLCNLPCGPPRPGKACRIYESHGALRFRGDPLRSLGGSARSRNRGVSVRAVGVFFEFRHANRQRQSGNESQR
jgi:hypothetical protein